MPNSHLLLWLEAPLQSWGADSKFNRRETLPFPTRSGVLGMVFAAMGAGGSQSELLARFLGLRQAVVSFARMDKKSQRIADETVMSDTINRASHGEPLLRDFHMIGAGYDMDDPWQSLLVPKKSDGKKPSGDVSGVTITARYYLQDAAFAVSLEVPGDLSESISSALQHPVWDVYLGRRCCAPTDMIYRGQFSSEDEALDRAAAIAEEKHRVENFRVIDGVVEDGDGESFTINDVPVQFGEEKVYTERKVSLIHVQ